jgi:uncharacterized membrane protein YhaH (DUF805 family)
LTGTGAQQIPPGGPSPPDLAWLLFRFDGRIGRELYWLGLGFIWSLFLAGVMMLGGDFEVAASAAAFWVMFLVSQWIELALLVKRLHDRDLPGFWALIKFLPFVGLLWMILAGVMAGDGGPNSYGGAADQRGGRPPAQGPGPDD